MYSLHIGVVYALFLFSACFLLATHVKRLPASKSIPFFVFLFALALRLVLAYYTRGYIGDTNYFGNWGHIMYVHGPDTIYTVDMLTDYPPLAMLLMWPSGAAFSLGNLTFGDSIHRLFLKAPAILSDIGAGYVLYREGRKYRGQTSGLFLSASYLFNPIILLDSSIWGQVDAFLVLPLLLMCVAIVENKMPLAYLSYGVGLMLKPQMLIFTPVLMAGIWDRVFLQDFSMRKFLYNLFSGLGVILGMLLLCIPFHLDLVIQKYIEAIGPGQIITYNAYNFWALLGLNYISQDLVVLGLPCRVWGNFVIPLIVLFTFLFSWRLRNDRRKYPLLASFIIITMFTFSLSMHERYLFAVTPCLLLAYIYQPEREIYASYAMLSILQTYNVGYVYLNYDPTGRPKIMFIISATIVCSTLWFYTILWRRYLSAKALLRNTGS